MDVQLSSILTVIFDMENKVFLFCNETSYRDKTTFAFHIHFLLLSLLVSTLTKRISFYFSLKVVTLGENGPPESENESSLIFLQGFLLLLLSRCATFSYFVPTIAARSCPPQAFLIKQVLFKTARPWKKAVLSYLGTSSISLPFLCVFCQPNEQTPSSKFTVLRRYLIAICTTSNSSGYMQLSGNLVLD